MSFTSADILVGKPYQCGKCKSPRLRLSVDGVIFRYWKCLDCGFETMVEK